MKAKVRDIKLKRKGRDEEYAGGGAGTGNDGVSEVRSEAR
jgi:hypothetical protein